MGIEMRRAERGVWIRESRPKERSTAKRYTTGPDQARPVKEGERQR
jgi:hypothetical protein